MLQEELLKMQQDCIQHCMDDVASDLVPRLSAPGDTCEASIFSNLLPLLHSMAVFSCVETIKDFKGLHCAGAIVRVCPRTNASASVQYLRIAPEPPSVDLVDSQTMQVLHRFGLSKDLVTLNKGFAWPHDEDSARRLCAELQEYGCCPFSFQRIATSMLMALCDIDKAVAVASLSSTCAAVGEPPCTLSERQRL